MFLLRTLHGRLTAAIQGPGVPPARGVPTPRQIPSYAYGAQKEAATVKVKVKVKVEHLL